MKSNSSTTSCCSRAAGKTLRVRCTALHDLLCSHCEIALAYAAVLDEVAMVAKQNASIFTEIRLAFCRARHMVRLNHSRNLLATSQ